MLMNRSPQRHLFRAHAQRGPAEDGRDKASSRYLSRTGIASSVVIPMRLTSGETEKDFAILIFPLPVLFRFRAAGSRPGPDTDASSKSSDLCIYKGAQDSHLYIEITLCVRQCADRSL